MTTDHEREPRGSPEFDTLLAEYVEELNLNGFVDPEEVLAQHPEIGPALLDDLKTYASMRRSEGGDEPLGTLGDYTLRRQIGRGGMGVVYEAWQGSLDRQVALKVLPVGLAADTRATSRFLREAQVAAKLNHPQVVSVYGFGVEQNSPYYAMEYVEGETLAQILTRLKDVEPEAETVFGKKDRPAYFEKLAEAFADVADGLQHAHSKGVIHRDIKPSNLILDGEGKLRILDFGLARLEGQESLTISGDVVGTLLYMSPEQARCQKNPVDHRTDVYSLGATLYEAICGRPPFPGKDHADTLSQIIERDPAEPRRVNPHVPKSLETIVLKCLRKDAGYRYGTAEALGQDLRRFVRGDTIEAVPQSRVDLWARRMQANRQRIAVGAVVGLLLILVAWFAARELQARRSERVKRYEEGVRRAAMVAHLGTLAGGGNIGPIRAVPFFEPDDLAGVSTSEAHPLETAVRELTRIEAEQPSRFEAPYHRARLLHLLGRVDEARKALRRSLSRREEFAPARALLHELDGRDTGEFVPEAHSWARQWVTADRAFREMRWKDAANSYTKLIGIEEERGELYLGSSIEIRLRRGIALLESGDTFASLDLAAAAALWPQFREPSLLLAAACHRDGRPELARRVLEDLYERSTSRNETAYWMVATARALGDYDLALEWADAIERGALREQVKAALLLFGIRKVEAVEAARSAIELEPEDPLNQALLAFTLVLRAENLGTRDREPLLKEALEAATRAYELRPDGSVMNATLGFVLQANRRAGEAERAIERALQLGEGQFAPMFCAGWVAYRRKDLPRAEEFLRKGAEAARAMGLAHEEAQFRNQLAYVVGDVEGPRAALEEWRRALDAFPLANAHLGIGFYYRWFLCDAETAERESRTATRINPRWPISWSYLAEALNVQGRHEEAFSAVEESMKWTPSPPEALWTRGVTLAHLGRFEEAVESLVEVFEVGASGGLRSLAAGHLFGVLFEYAPSGGDAQLDPLVAELDVAFNLEDEPSGVRLAAAAMVLTRARARRDLERASIFAERAVRAEANRYTLAAVASVEYARGEEARAVRTLERAVADPRGLVCFQGVLDRWRGELAGKHVSYATVDARGVDPSDPEIGVAVRSSPSDSAGDRDPWEARASLYARARQLEEAERLVEAEKIFRELALEDPESPAPRLGVFRALTAQGEAERAEEFLRGWLLSKSRGALGHSTHAWEQWIAHCFTQLYLDPAEVLVKLGPTVEGDTPPPSGYLRDLRWLLERLGSSGRGSLWIGVLAGSEADGLLEGREWSRDRFHFGGRSRGWGDSEDLDSTGRLYGRTCRFGPGRDPDDGAMIGRSYRIPLPPGHYRVTLWLSVESCDAAEGETRKVLIESRVPERCEEIAVEYVSACRRSTDVAVADGLLDIDFDPGTRGVNVAGIEIERLE